MALQKQPIEVLFDQGVDTKTDPNKVPAGKLLELENAVFDMGSLNKRNGFGDLSTVPDSTALQLATLNDNLLALGANLQAYNANTASWVNRGSVQTVQLATQAIGRSSKSQTAPDMAMASSGIACMVWVENSLAYYSVLDSSTGQRIVDRTLIASTATNPRVFLLGRNFIVTFVATVAAAPHLQYISVPVASPSSPSAATDISTAISALSAGYDGCVANNRLFLAWNGNDGGGAVRTASLSSTLVVATSVAIAGKTANLVSVSADSSQSSPVIYVCFWNSGDNKGYVAAYDSSLNVVHAATLVINTAVISELTSYATAGICTVLYQVTNTYSYSAARSDFVRTVTCTSAGVVGTPATMLRSVGLASKPFAVSGAYYVLLAYGQTFQPTYLLSDMSGNLLAKLAYANGGGYAASQVLPTVSVSGSVASVPYVYKSELVSVNKAQGVASVAGIYAQTGINAATFTFGVSQQSTAEIGNSLHVTGGFLRQYDGVKPVEHGFHVWPEDVAVTTSGAGGLITAQQYYYQFCYEWTDAAGNLHRSAPSVPAGIVTVGATSTNTINVPTLRLTAKTGANVVRIVGYRWSTAQQSYYQFTSIASPTLNDTTADSVAITDTLADSAILGNTLLYTTGGVVENIAAPACTDSALVGSRMFVLDAEDRNLVWFSKQVIEATPVEFSDLFTKYVPPTTGAQGSTGPVRCLSAMDDKAIFFKDSAIYYMTGAGPDNTGSQNDFSEPTFITSTVGCSNSSSIVMVPAGLMFQSNKGIWLLGRNLSTQYIGADVEAFTDSGTVMSALAIPGTNQVRFTLDTGAVLMYDYYYQQWGTFTGVPAASATLYNGLHTYLNSAALVRQETPGSYLDGSKPVLMRFRTAWLKLAGLQGFQRAYFFYLLAKYISPHKLNVQIAYDFDDSVKQTVLISPTNSSSTYGSDALYGSGSVYGGSSANENWRVFLQQQQCEAISVTVTELFDSTKGLAAGAGFTLSGLSMVIGAKKRYPTRTAAQSAG